MFIISNHDTNLQVFNVSKEIIVVFVNIEISLEICFDISFCFRMIYPISVLLLIIVLILKV